MTSILLLRADIYFVYRQRFILFTDREISNGRALLSRAKIIKHAGGEALSLMLAHLRYIVFCPSV